MKLEVTIDKPRIVRCGLTGVWVVNTAGQRHRCDPHYRNYELAFKNWGRALDWANGEAKAKYARELERWLR